MSFDFWQYYQRESKIKKVALTTDLALLYNVEAKKQSRSRFLPAHSVYVLPELVAHLSLRSAMNSCDLLLLMVLTAGYSDQPAGIRNVTD